MSFYHILPAYLLNRSPAIIVAFDTDFLHRLDAFEAAFRRSGDLHRGGTILLQLGWTQELPEVAGPNRALLKTAREKFPAWRIVVLANTAAEVKVFEDITECIWVNQNAFLDPARYPLAKKARAFDAVYVARITPFKRHELAVKVKNLLLIGAHSTREAGYFAETMKLFPEAAYIRKVSSWLIGRRIREARCGLALSAAEGSMFVSGEYMLCGIPVVNTRNLGGRDVLMPDFAMRYAEDTPESVAEEVQYWVENPVEPAAIREAFLKAAAPHKARLQELVNGIAGRRVTLPHKLGVRCPLLPHRKLLHGIRG